jgi:hypothetical protein
MRWINKYRFHLVVLVIIAVFLGIINELKNGSTFGRRNTAFAIDDPDRVNEIVISATDNQVRLTKEDGKWFVNSGKEARVKSVDLMLQTLQRLRVSGPLPLNDRERILERINDSSVRVDVKRGRRYKSFYVYSEGIHYPTFMMLKGSRQAFRVEVLGFSGHVASLFIPEDVFWRPNILFNHKPDNIAEVVVRYRDAQKGSFTLRQSEEKEFTLFTFPEKVIPCPVNDSMAIRYLTNFFFVPFERFADERERFLTDSLQRSEADYWIRITEFNGEVSEVLFHRILSKQTDDSGNEMFDHFRLHALINNRSEMVVVPYHSVDLLLRTYSYFN